MKVLYFSLIVVVIDQVTKLMVKGFSIPFLNLNYAGMNYGERIPVVDDFINITFVENPGIAFGIYFGEEYKLLLSIFTLAASLGLLLYLYFIRERSVNQRLAIAMIFGGAVGNLIDRTFYGVFYGYSPLFFGKVVDFIDFRLLNVYMFNKTMGNYIFNFADVAVTIGVILLLFSYREKASSKNTDSQLQEEINPPIENYLAENKD